MENKRIIGSKYETMACEYLKHKGYTIECTNYRCKLGEIDIIAKDKDYLVFVEVKYRSSCGFGSPLEAVDYKKQQRIRNVAQMYLLNKNISFNIPIRFDVIAILGDEVELVEDAF